VLPDGLKLIETYDGDFRAPAVIVTAGGNPRKLGVPGEEEFAGRGVSYCAVCDGAFFKDVHLAVVGGGDAAVEEALFLTRYASKVTIIHRRRSFRAQPILLDEARRHPKVEFITDTVIDSIDGDAKVSRLSLRNLDSERHTELEVGGVFIFIGFIPNTGLVDAHIDHDKAGYYLTDPMTMMTNIPGIFAAGDVRSQLTRQITTAVGDATTATIAASKWVEEWRRGRDETAAELADLSVRGAI
jgi:thioredoxin reductase (NADPH)